MAKKVLVDTGYWIALFNERDQHHVAAQVLENELAIHTLLVPWPTLFECVDTRLSRRRDTAVLKPPRKPEPPGGRESPQTESLHEEIQIQ